MPHQGVKEAGAFGFSRDLAAKRPIARAPTKPDAQSGLILLFDEDRLVAPRAHPDAIAETAIAETVGLAGLRIAHNRIDKTRDGCAVALFAGQREEAFDRAFDQRPLRDVFQMQKGLIEGVADMEQHRVVRSIGRDRDRGARFFQCPPAVDVLIVVLAGFEMHLPAHRTGGQASQG